MTLAAALLALALAAPPDAVRLAEVEMFALQAGATRIANFTADGRDGLIVAGWRDNGNAHGFHVYMVLVPGAGADDVVTFADEADAVTIADAPHTGEDYVRSVRFGRGMLNGRRETLVFVATRRIEGPYPDPAHALIRLLALRGRDEPTGPLWSFAEQARFETGRRYCNADAALRTELGVPLPADYQGPDSADGCGP